MDLRVNFGPVRGDFKSVRVDLGLLVLISGLKEPDLGLRGMGGMDGQTEGWMEGRTDGQMDRWINGCKEIHPCVLQDIGPLGPIHKKGTDRPMDKPIDPPTNLWTNKVGCGVVYLGFFSALRSCWHMT